MSLTKFASAVGVLVIAAVVAAMLLLPRITRNLVMTNPKPATVPDDFVPIRQIGKTWTYAKCWVEGSDTRCRVFAGNGEVLLDDVFKTYDRGVSVAAADLTIVPGRSGRDYLWLTNGEVLLPATNYDEHRRSVEKLVKLYRE